MQAIVDEDWESVKGHAADWRQDQKGKCEGKDVAAVEEQETEDMYGGSSVEEDAVENDINNMEPLNELNDDDSSDLDYEE
jgi:hypothetical protein